MVNPNPLPKTKIKKLLFHFIFPRLCIFKILLELHGFK